MANLIPINSLQDLLMLRELKKNSNLGFTAMQALADGISMGIKQQQEEAKKKKEQEDQIAKISQIQKSAGAGTKIKTTLDSKGGTSIVLTSGDDDESSLKKERLELSKKRLESDISNQKRLAVKDKFLAARQIGGILKPEDMDVLNKEIGFNLGTDLRSGRIEKTDDGKYRVLSDEEFGKKSDIIKSSKDAESSLNIVLKDLDQVSNMFDSVPQNLKGPIEGRTKGVIKGALGETNVSIYNDVVKAFTSNIARSILLEKGVLTNQDIERAIGLLPRLSDTEEIKRGKISQIKTLLKTRFDEYNRRTNNSLGTNNIIEKENEPPEYNRNTQKLQRNKNTGEYRVVPK